MKKSISVVLVLAMLLLLCPVAFADSSQAVTIKIGEVYTDTDGSNLGAAYIDANSRTMVPLRALANKLGLSVSWDAATKTASFSDGSTTVAFIQNASTYTINGVSASMNTSVVNRNGRTYAPARYLAEAFGYDVSWDGTTKTVYIQHNSEPMTVTVKSGKVTPADITYVAYRYKSSSFNYDVLVITNKSDYDCCLEVSASYYDATGKLVDIGSDSVAAFAAHSSVAVYNMPDHDFTSVSYSFTVSSVSRYYRTCTQNLKIQYNTTDSSIVGTVTNNGSYTAEFVEVTTLFFKNGKIVDMSSDYACDSADSEYLSAGVSGNFKCACYDPFDTVQVYVDARAGTD